MKQREDFTLVMGKTIAKCYAKTCDKETCLNYPPTLELATDHPTVKMFDKVVQMRGEENPRKFQDYEELLEEFPDVAKVFFYAHCNELFGPICDISKEIDINARRAKSINEKREKAIPGGGLK